MAAVFQIFEKLRIRLVFLARLAFFIFIEMYKK